MDKESEKLIQEAIKGNKVKALDAYLHQYGDMFKISSDSFLHTAISTGNMDIITKLLERGASISCKSKKGFLPLHIAVTNNSIEQVQQLLKYGANINCLSDSEMTPLLIAVSAGYTDLVKYLTEHGANVNSPASITYSNNTPLHMAAQLKNASVVKVLLEHRAKINTINSDSQTALQLAASKGNLEVVRCLVQYGADIHSLVLSNPSPFALACQQGHSAVVNYLASKMSPDDLNAQLDNAIRSHNIDIVRSLLANGGDANFTPMYGTPPLHLAIGRCSHPMSGTWGKRKGMGIHVELEMIDTLICYGVDINHCDHNGTSALHECVKTGCEAVLEYLINSGINYRLTDVEGDTALHLACQRNITNAIMLLIRLCPGLSHMSYTHPYKQILPLLCMNHNYNGIQLLCNAGYKLTQEEVTGNTDMANFHRSGKSHKRVDKSIKDFLLHTSNNPWSLVKISRTAIRTILDADLQNKVVSLPIPDQVQRMILLA